MPIDDQPVDGGNLGGTGVHTGLAQRMSDDPQPNRLWLTCNTSDADHQADTMLESLVSPAAQARGVSVDTAADDAGQSTVVTASPITSSDR
mgnify:CR=1 FL=1